MKRCSSWVWLGSGLFMASGSPKTVVASAKETPCFRAFASAFSGFHSNSYPTNTFYTLQERRSNEARQYDFPSEVGPTSGTLAGWPDSGQRRLLELKPPLH